jgi:hypothetical protein
VLPRTFCCHRLASGHRAYIPTIHRDGAKRSANTCQAFIVNPCFLPSVFSWVSQGRLADYPFSIRYSSSRPWGRTVVGVSRPHRTGGRLSVTLRRQRGGRGLPGGDNGRRVTAEQTPFGDTFGGSRMLSPRALLSTFWNIDTVVQTGALARTYASIRVRNDERSRCETEGGREGKTNTEGEAGD